MSKLQGWFTGWSNGISIFYQEVKDNTELLPFTQHFELRAFVDGLYTKNLRTVAIDAELVSGDIGNLESMLEPYADSLYKVVKNGLLRKVVMQLNLSEDGNE
jgi:hypothetical protein